MLKKLKEGAEFPDDFWNYNVNHILGYKYNPNRNEQGTNTERKYAKPRI